MEVTVEDSDVLTYDKLIMGIESQTMGSSYDWQANKSLGECNKYMLTNQIGCDVGFLVGDDSEVVFAHKFILISRSCVFYAMLHGLMAEQTDKYITVPDIEKDTFKLMLEYMYCEDTKVDMKNALPLLYAARKYCIPGLAEKCVRCMEHGITTENVCSMLFQAHKFDEIHLKKRCIDHILHQPKDILRSSSFCDLPESCVKEILNSNDLDAKEEVIFEAALRWSEMECMRHEVLVSAKNQRKALGGILYCVRFPVMEPNVFDKLVPKCELLSQEETDAIKDYHSGKNKNIHRFTTTVRARGSNQTLHWRFGPVSCIRNDETAISFSTSKAVLVEGVQIDGSDYEEELYEANLSIFDVSNKELAKTKTKISLKKKQPIFKVIFPAAPKIEKGYKYTVILKIQGSHGYYGASGKSCLSLHSATPTCVNPEDDFNKVASRKDTVPAILIKPYFPNS